MEFQNIIYIIANIFMAFAIHKFMNVFFEKRKTPFYISLSCYIFYLIITSCAFLIISIPLVNLACTILTLTIITLNYESSIKRKISTVCFVYIFMFIADIIGTTSTGYIYNSIIVKTKYDNIIGFIIIAVILYVEALLAQNFKNIKRNNPVSSVFWISTFTIPISSVFISILVLNYSEINQTIQIIFIFSILLISILTFYLHDSLSAAYTDKLKSKLSEQEKEYYYNQCELMRKSIDEIKAYRHDNKNHLTAINDFIRNNQTDKAGEYLSKLINYVETDTVYSNTGNTAFDSIINYKLRNVKENNITLQIDVSVPHELNMDVADIVTVTGNLLDNAINATLKASEKRITLKVNYNKGRILIYVENTFNGEVKTTNDDKEHGFGLRNVQKSVDKYNGLLEINNTDSVFAVNVLLYISTD